MSHSAKLASLVAAGLFGGISDLVADSAIAQDGPAEFTNAPCSSLTLGRGDGISHLQRIYPKLAIRSRTELAALVNAARPASGTGSGAQTGIRPTT